MTGLREILEDATRDGDETSWATTADVRSRGERLRRRRRRRRLAAPVAAVAVLVGGTTPAWWPSPDRVVPVEVAPTGPIGQPSEPCAGQPPGCGTAQGSAAALAGGSWRTIPAGPIAARARAGEAWGWAADRLIIWGGESASMAALDDGATYDPLTQSWAPLPPSPLTGRWEATAVVADNRLMIWGGANRDRRYLSDGAAYDPSSRTWTMLPPSPLSPRARALSLWTGSAMIVIGGSNSDQYDMADAAFYTPATRSWQRLPARPRPQRPAGSTETLVSTAAAWTGYQLIAIDTYELRTACPGMCTATEGVSSVNAWQPGATAWATLPSPPASLSTYMATATWTGHDVVLAGGTYCLIGESCPPGVGGQVGALDPTTGRWTLGMELRPAPQGPQVWTGKALVLLNAPLLQPRAGSLATDQTIAYDDETAAWTQLPAIGSSELSGAAAVWTGTELIVWSANRSGGFASSLVPSPA